MRLDTLYKRNTNPNLYQEAEYTNNCGSFALGIEGWYCPYIIEDDDVEDALWQYTELERMEWIEGLVSDGYTREDIMESVIERDFDFILKTCPWLVPISEKELDPKDRVIAYRLSMDDSVEPEEFSVDNDMDFHFRVLIDGVWWEKNGGGPVHKVADPDNDVWIAESWLIYDGPIKYAKFREGA